MSVRMRYSLEVVQNPPSLEWPDPRLAVVDVDPDQSTEDALRGGLLPWAAERLSELDCEFGLYAADLSVWFDDDGIDCSLRGIYIIWNGEVVAAHIDDLSTDFDEARDRLRLPDSFDRHDVDA